MSYTRVDGAEIEPAPGPHPACSAFDKSVGQALGVRACGLYHVVELDSLALPETRERLSRDVRHWRVRILLNDEADTGLETQISL